MLVLSDEPKAIVLAAERLIELDANIRRLFTRDRLAFQINDYIRELRTNMTENGSYIGTAGFMVIRYWNDEDGEEIRVMLDVTTMHTFTSDEPTQQFHHNDGPWTYDESVPDDWRDDEDDTTF